MLLFKRNEAEAATGPRVDILEDDCIDYLPKLVEMFFQLLISEFEVKTSNEDFALRVSELDIVFALSGLRILCLANDVGVRLLDLLPARSRDCLVALVRLQTVLRCCTLLVVVC